MREINNNRIVLMNFKPPSVSNRCLIEVQRSVIVGLHFKLHKAELHHLKASGEFSQGRSIATEEAEIIAQKKA